MSGLSSLDEQLSRPGNAPTIPLTTIPHDVLLLHIGPQRATIRGSGSWDLGKVRIIWRLINESIWGIGEAAFFPLLFRHVSERGRGKALLCHTGDSSILICALGAPAAKWDRLRSSEGEWASMRGRDRAATRGDVTLALPLPLSHPPDVSTFPVAPSYLVFGMAAAPPP